MEQTVNSYKNNHEFIPPDRKTKKNGDTKHSRTSMLQYCNRVGLNIPQPLFLAIFFVVSDRRTGAR
jgi:hypothetical protein